MPLPVVSKMTATSVAAESLRGSQFSRAERVISNYKRLSISNPTIGKVMFYTINTEHFQKVECLATHAFGFGTDVYRLLEIEFRKHKLRMPYVSESVVGPLRVSFERDFNTYAWKKLETLIKGENPEIANAAIRWFTHFESCNDRNSTESVLCVGISVYHMIENQWNADELLKTIGGKL